MQPSDLKVYLPRCPLKRGKWWSIIAPAKLTALILGTIWDADQYRRPQPGLQPGTLNIFPPLLPFINSNTFHRHLPSHNSPAIYSAIFPADLDHRYLLCHLIRCICFDISLHQLLFQFNSSSPLFCSLLPFRPLQHFIVALKLLGISGRLLKHHYLSSNDLLCKIDFCIRIQHLGRIKLSLHFVARLLVSSRLVRLPFPHCSLSIETLPDLLLALSSLSCLIVTDDS